MRPRWFPAPLVSGLIWAAAVAWTVSSYLREGLSSDIWLLAVAFGVVSIGELLEVDLRGGRSTPVSAAVIFALFVVMDPPDLFVVVIPAFVVGVIVTGRSLGFARRFRSVSRRLGSLLLARWFYLLAVDGLMNWFSQDSLLLVETGVMVFAGFFQLLLDTAASSMFIANAQHIPMRRLWAGQMGNRMVIYGAFLSVAALMALAYEPLGPATFILFLLPLAAARYAFKRYASIHKLYSQTVRALARVPELAGYAPDGHSIAVADLAAAVGREFGFSDDEVQDLEFAGLLRDVGRLSVGEEVSSSQITDASAELVGKTPYLARVARIIRSSERGGPDEDPMVSLAAKIVRSCNDYVVGVRDPSLDLSARMAIMAGDERNDPEVVRALGRVLRARPTSAS